MPNLIRTKSVLIGPGYKLVEIEHNARLWIALMENAPNGFICFWSQKLPITSDTELSEKVFLEIEDCLYKIHSQATINLFALTLWLKGWEFWGGGIPVPIDEGFRGAFRSNILKEIQKAEGSIN